MAGFGGKDLGQYYAPHPASRALFAAGVVLVPAGILAGIGLRIGVAAQGVGSLINGTQSILERPWYYAATQGTAIATAFGARLLGFGNNSRGARLVLLPQGGPAGPGRSLSGRF